MVGGSVESGCNINKLSENIRFVSSKRSYSGENVRYHDCPKTDRQKCEDRARILETECSIMPTMVTAARVKAGVESRPIIPGSRTSLTLEPFKTHIS